MIYDAMSEPSDPEEPESRATLHPVSHSTFVKTKWVMHIAMSAVLKDGEGFAETYDDVDCH